MQSQTGTRVQVDQQNWTCTITGPPQGVDQCAAMIMAITAGGDPPEYRQGGGSGGYPHGGPGGYGAPAYAPANGGYGAPYGGPHGGYGGYPPQSGYPPALGGDHQGNWVLKTSDLRPQTSFIPSPNCHLSHVTRL